MAVQSLIEQHIIFISPTHVFDENAIMANSLIQSLANNSQGNALVHQFKFYSSWNGSVWTDSAFFELVCYVTSAFQTTIQTNIPTLQAAFPQYTIVTWGGSVNFGN